MSGLYIIGGGASGLAASIAAAEAGAHPVLVTGRTAPGKKILATGNGRCNFTNLRMKKDCYSSSWTDGPMQVIRSFGSEDTIRFFRELGLLSCDRDGYVYPRSMQAASVRDALLAGIRRQGVQMIEEDPLSALTVSDDGGYRLQLASGRILRADCVILAAGGCAAPSTGSDGSGLRIAEKLGLKVIPAVPALTGLLSDDPCCPVWHGVRTHARVTVCDRNGKPHSDTGEVQLMKNGISGIPVFQISRHTAYVLMRSSVSEAVIDFIPEDDSALRETLRIPDLTISEVLKGAFPAKLAEVFLQKLGVRPDTGAARVNSQKLFHLIHSFRIPITGVRGFAEAQVTAGGVDLRSVDTETMESKKFPGLFLAGEILDADGICGGYNLQWAFATGILAGTAAASKVRS